MSIVRRKIVTKYFWIMVGVLLLALALNIYLDPQSLVTGGATGLGIIIQEVSEDMFGRAIPLWITNLIINVPLLLIASKIKGRTFILRTFFATLFLSFALFITGLIPTDVIQSDMLLAAVFGGVLSGIGIGLVFRNGATTGGSDLAAWLIHHFFKDLSLSKLMFIIDTSIIVLGFFVFGAERTMYAIISVFISTKSIDAVLEGLNFAKATLIITNDTQAVSSRVMVELDRGVTLLNATGGYTGDSKQVILCVTSSKEMPKLREIVAAIDMNAFMIVADVREVLGEGFQAINGD